MIRNLVWTSFFFPLSLIHSNHDRFLRELFHPPFSERYRTGPEHDLPEISIDENVCIVTEKKETYTLYQEGPKPSAVWIIVPAYNEESIIHQVISDLTTFQKYSIVVIDDGSRDNTVSCLRDLPVHIIGHESNQGTGAALQHGFDYAFAQKGEIFVTFDADGQHQSGDIEKMIEPLLEKRCDVVLGSRFLNKNSRKLIPWGRRFLLQIAILATRFLTSLPITDTHNGFRAFSRDAIKKLQLKQKRMAHASEIISFVAKHKLPFQEVPVTIYYTPYSLEKGQRGIHFLEIVRDLIKMKLFTSSHDE